MVSLDFGSDNFFQIPPSLLYTASIDTASIVSEGMLVEVTVWSLGMLCQALTRIYVKFKVVSNDESPTQELFSNKSLILSFFTFILPTAGSKIGFPRIIFKTFFLVCKITLVPIQILSTHEKARAYFINNHPKVKMLICDQANPQPTSTGESIVQQEVEEVSNSTIEDQFQVEVERAKILAGSRRDEPKLKLKSARRDERAMGLSSNWRDETSEPWGLAQIGETSRDELWLEPTSQKRARIRL